ncbi:MAG: hypothetical protein N3F66_14380 [Spirochaetes bacterium]|nr:hypothetical protein [Spirochaetota bacterium]
MMKKLSIFILAITFLHTIALGYSILPNIVQSQKHFVKTTRDLTLSPTPTIKVYILKNVPITKNNITLEAYYTFKKPAHVKSPFTSNDRLLIINILHSVSTMQGIQYYSQTRKKLRTLFEKSYVIQYPSFKQLDDPVIKDLKQVYTFYTLQKDRIFGEITYQYTIYQMPEFILLKTENINSVKYVMMTVVEKRKFKFFLFIIDKGEDIGLYCVYSIDILGNMAFPLQKVKDSLYHRSDAIINWLYNKLMQN